MAGRGPAPKAASERARRNADPIPAVTVTADGEVRGPELPPLEDGDWPALTLVWWETWRRSPQAATFIDTDWVFLLETALLHAAFVRGNTSLASEVRLRVAKYGATPEDRARLRLAIAPAQSAPAQARAADEVSRKRRERLEKAAGE